MEILTLQSEITMLPRNIRIWLPIHAASKLRRTETST